MDRARRTEPARQRSSAGRIPGNVDLRCEPASNPYTSSPPYPRANYRSQGNQASSRFDPLPHHRGMNSPHPRPQHAPSKVAMPYRPIRRSHGGGASQILAAQGTNPVVEGHHRAAQDHPRHRPVATTVVTWAHGLGTHAPGPPLPPPSRSPPNILVSRPGPGSRPAEPAITTRLCSACAAATAVSNASSIRSNASTSD